jgi:hypothetical protein
MKKYPLVLVALWLAGAIAMILCSIRLSGGHLIYTLDDPYIHLAVAESILQGGYGINAGEYAAPSSSIAYPFLLALTEWAGFGAWGPLVVNLLAMAGAVLVVGRIVQDHVLAGGRPGGSRIYSTGFQLVLGLLICLDMNAWGLVMTGMEHSLHVLAEVVVLWRFLELIEKGRRADKWLVAAIVALPLIRFEGLALSLLAMAGMAYLGQRRAALVALLLTLLALLGWYRFTQSAGLPLLPSSVLLKSNVAASMVGQSGLPQLGTIFGNLRKSMENRQGVVLMLGLLLLGILSHRTYLQGDRKAAAVLGGSVFLTGTAHVFFGHYGWFYRYEVYVIGLVALAILVMGRRHLVHGAVKTVVLLALLIVGAPYLQAAIQTPAASRGIYQQQYQMHRFAVDYWKMPVAVNDLGWVSYRNQAFVLDLYGLGSEQVRRLRMAGDWDAGRIESIVHRRGISLIMIYDDWFVGFVPQAWNKVATLETSRVTSASGRVAFYVTPGTDRLAVQRLLQQFGATLPPGARLILGA